ncbi:HAD family hydrolase [Telmatospirillum sp. J64-1]|uniref:HAD family hydrolase n=1 Tax=Telmatospirillum sp. J64-1 TaxID=2502183 RepID=UPI00115E5720|nr:HAD family hydrolase [Telmatospirillum sp. J64-1]
MTVSLRLAVFDVDGTLIDSQHNIIAAMTEAWRAHGYADPRPEAVRRIIGLSLVEAVATLMPEASPEEHLKVAHAYKDAFFTLRQAPDHHEPLFPGAREALARLEDEGWLLAVATGKTRRGLDAMIERHGLEGIFVSLQTADGNPGKPHPGMLLRAVEEAGAETANSVMIGDTTFDMQMARSAGTGAVGVAWGYHAASELRAAGAHVLVEDYGHLPGLLPGLIGSEREGEEECVSARS